MDRQPVCVFVGPLPPPVTGQTRADLGMVTLLRSTISIRVIALATQRGTSRSFVVGRSVKVLRYLRAMFAVLAARPSSMLLSLDRGGGQHLQALVVVALFLSKGCRLVAIHHTWDGTALSFSLRAAARIARVPVTHLALCGAHRAKIIETNNIKPGDCLVLSNIVWMESELRGSQVMPASVVGRISMLSNLTEAKGVGMFLELAEYCSVNRPDLHFVLAGPVSEPHLVPIVNSHVEKGVIEYLGSIDSEGRDRLLKSTSVFVLPTKYAAETEPLVILEALASGTPVVSTERGCIPEHLPDRWVVQGHSDLSEWVSAIDLLNTADASVEAMDLWQRLCSDAALQSASLVKLLEGN